MSSHREAPEISKDPVADNADSTRSSARTTRRRSRSSRTTSRSRDRPAARTSSSSATTSSTRSTSTTTATRSRRSTYQFQFHTRLQNPNTFLYNTGPISSLNDPNWNKRQLYSVSVIHAKRTGKKQDHSRDGKGKVLGTDLACPPCNIGPRSTPNYERLAAAAVHTLGSGETVFAGQRNDGFFVDLGAIFDLGDLRPFNEAHLIPTPTADERRRTQGGQRPRDRDPGADQRCSRRTAPSRPIRRRPCSVLGIWAGASRRKVSRPATSTRRSKSGPWTQVSRLGNPLFNEVIVPLGEKDDWNAVDPSTTRSSREYVAAAGAREAPAGALPRRRSRTSRRYTKTGPTSRRSC